MLRLEIRGSTLEVGGSKQTGGTNTGPQSRDCRLRRSVGFVLPFCAFSFSAMAPSSPRREYINPQNKASRRGLRIYTVPEDSFGADQSEEIQRCDSLRFRTIPAPDPPRRAPPLVRSARE